MRPHYRVAVLLALSRSGCELFRSPVIDEAEVRFRAEPGRLYLVRAQEKLHGSDQFRVWIEDAQSRSLVGGMAPVTQG